MYKLPDSTIYLVKYQVTVGLLKQGSSYFGTRFNNNGEVNSRKLEIDVEDVFITKSE